MASAPDPIDRRAFLGGAGALGVALVTGAGTTQASNRRRAVLGAKSAPATLRQAMRGPIFNRGAAGYRVAAEVYNERFDQVMPSAVGRPLASADVQGAVKWAVAHDVPLRARSGGHSYAGYSTLSGGVVLDLRNLSSISVDTHAGTATIGAGAQLIDVYRALAAHGVTIPAGSCPSVGIGGHALGGGMGLAGRAFGLTTDNILAAKIVTADGRLRTVNRHTDPGLLWALRGGGGGNFGIVTQLQMRVHNVPRTSSWFQVTWPWSSASEAIAAWQAWAPHARNQLSSVFHLSTGGSAPTVSVTGQYLGPASDLNRLLAPLRAADGATLSFGNQDYFGLQTRFAGCLGRSVTSCHTHGTRPGGMLERASFNAKSDYVTKPLPRPGGAR